LIRNITPDAANESFAASLFDGQGQLVASARRLSLPIPQAPALEAASQSSARCDLPAAAAAAQQEQVSLSETRQLLYVPDLAQGRYYLGLRAPFPTPYAYQQGEETDGSEVPVPVPCAHTKHHGPPWREDVEPGACSTLFDSNGHHYRFKLRTRDLPEGRYRVSANLRNHATGSREIVIERERRCWRDAP